MFFKHIPHVISTFLRKFATKTTHKIMMIGRNASYMLKDYNDGVNAKLIRMGYTICCHYG